jgi:hypothetical protein
VLTLFNETDPLLNITKYVGPLCKYYLVLLLISTCHYETILSLVILVMLWFPFVSFPFYLFSYYRQNDKEWYWTFALGNPQMSLNASDIKCKADLWSYGDEQFAKLCFSLLCFQLIADLFPSESVLCFQWS